LNHNSPKAIKTVLKTLKIKLKKRWGQNFIIDPGIREKLLSILNPGQNDHIWEIGPGLGAMTELLMQKTNHLVLFEIDSGLIQYLEKSFHIEIKKQNSLFYIVRGDFIKTWEQEARNKGIPDLIFGNLPYRSASAIISGIILSKLSINHKMKRMVFTVQKELAGRILAKTKSKNYSSFSLLCQLHFYIKSHGDISPGVFYPKPEVTSTILSFEPAKLNINNEQKSILLGLIQGLFSFRRKTIRNNILHNKWLKSLNQKKLINSFEHLKINLNQRPEEITKETFLDLTRLYLS
jgi:16S rRNA (adenine1518-N6/adenine1519-N6)-dimethyltransferase